MPTVRTLDDGSNVFFDDNADVNYIARELKEKNLAIALLKKQAEHRLSPEYNPSETLEEDAIGTKEASGRGILAGLLDIATNPVSGAGYLLQAAGQEDAGEAVVNSAKSVQERFSPAVEGLGLAQDLPRALVQFGVPGAAIIKAIKGTSMATKAIALGLGEGLVASEDQQTMGDAFLGIGPTLTKDLEHLSGQEKAYQALLNKGKVGLEGAALAAGIPQVFSVMGATFLGTAQLASKVPGVKQTFKAIDDFTKSTSKAIDKTLKESPNLDKFAGLFRYRGSLPSKEFAEIRDARSVEFSALAFKNQLSLDEVNTTLEKAFKSGKDNSVTEKNIMDALDDYLFPADDILDVSSARYAVDYSQALAKQAKAAEILVETDKKLGWVSKNLSVNTKVDDIESEVSLFRAAKRARESIDQYSERIRNRPEFLPKGVEETLGGQLGLYSSRQYRAFLDPGWTPTEESAEKALELVMNSNKKLGIRLTREEAISDLNSLTSSKGFLNSSLNPKDLVDDQVISKVSNGILKGRNLNSKIIREYLGEYTTRPTFAGRTLSVDERKANLMVKAKETMGRQAALIAKGNFIKNLDDYNKILPKENKIFLDSPPLIGKDYVQIPLKSVGYGPLQGKWVKKSYLSALEKNKDSWYQNVPIFGSAYSAFLGVKGISQLGKTVYNVTGQIRNVVSAMGFAVANGNLPNGSTFSEAWTLVGGNIQNKFAKNSDMKKAFEYYIEKGIVGQQAQLGELKSLIEEAATHGGAAGKLFSSKIMEKAQNNIMTKLYQGGDDVWRIFNFETESQKLFNMITSSQVKKVPFMMKATTSKQIQMAKEAGLDPNNLNVLDLKNKKLIKEFAAEEAALITRDVVPNYERVPEIVQMLRRTPLGNFIAYPAEIIRTSTNILGQAIKELSSDNPYLRERGMERLLGFGAMTTGIPVGATAVGMMATGANEEQVAAFKRSFAFPWEKTATLIPISTDDKGNITEVVNLSYTMPYDYLTRPFSAIQQAVDNGVTSEKEYTRIASDAIGMMYQDMFSPFLGESMVTERINDVFIRDGETKFGSRVWDSATNLSLGEKSYAAIAHVLNGLVPTISPVKLNPKVSLLKAAKSIPGDGTLGEKITYATFRGFDVGDLPRSVLVESQLIDPKYRVSDRSKRQVDFFGEMTEAMSGVKGIKWNIKTKLKYKATEAAGELRVAQEELRRLRKTHGYRVPEEYLNAYKKANEIRFRALKDLSVAVDDAEYLGVSKGEIYKTLQDAKVSDWQNVVNNNFIPYAPPPGVFTDAYEVNENKVRNTPDMEEISRQYAGDLNQQLSPQIQRPIVNIPEPSTASIFKRKSEINPQEKAAQVLRQEEMRKLLGL